MRSDAKRNRDRLLDSARALFAERGGDVPLEDVAQAAGVSRTTLYRHFVTREELAATIFEESVADIERRSAALRDRPDGVKVLLDFVLDSQLSNRGFAQVLSGADLEWFTTLSQRTLGAFEPLLEAGHEAGIVHPEVDVTDLMLAFPMAAGVFADDDAAGRVRASERVRAMVHRALFAR